MEKYSAFRDPGTGIQPFLRPVPVTGTDHWTWLLFPFRMIFGALRVLVTIVCVIIYLVLVYGFCVLILPIAPLERAVRRVFTAVVARVVLLLVGCLWISVETVSRKRGRGLIAHKSWNPGAGDIIVSNWVSWIEVLWLALRFDPIFVLPVFEAATVLPQAPASPPIARIPGQRPRTNSPAVSSSTRLPSTRKTVVGFRSVSLLSLLQLTGRVPPYGSVSDTITTSLEELCRTANRPIVIFPECTTSNGRGILRFADFLSEPSHVMNFKMFIMCVRYDSPTALKPTLSHATPSQYFNPLPHLYTLTTGLVPQNVYIRLLAPSESPNNPLPAASDVLHDLSSPYSLMEACEILIAQIGKVKRVGLGWEDKAAFLDFFREKRK